LGTIVQKIINYLICFLEGLNMKPLDELQTDNKRKEKMNFPYEFLNWNQRSWRKTEK
jgi:hypothetical protein